MKGFGSRKEGGFSLPEIMLVVGIAAVITMVAVPSVTNVIANAKLRASMTSLSGLFQNTRMMAVQQNKTKTAHFQGGVTTQLVGYVKDAGDSNGLAATDTQIEMEAPITKLTAPTGTGAPSEIASATLGYTPQTGEPSFNSRGLPCAYSSGTCTNHGFIYYFKDNRISGSGGWAAISISPAGRITRWFYNGSAWTY